MALSLPAQNCESLSEPHLLLQRPFSGACLKQKVTNERLTVCYPLHVSFPQHLKVEAISPMPLFVNRVVQINTGCSVKFLEFSVTHDCRKTVRRSSGKNLRRFFSIKRFVRYTVGYDTNERRYNELMLQ